MLFFRAKKAKEKVMLILIVVCFPLNVHSRSLRMIFNIRNLGLKEKLSYMHLITTKRL